MPRKRKTTDKPSAPELTVAQLWAKGILEMSEPFINIPEIQLVFNDIEPKDVVSGMIEAFISVAESDRQLKEASLFVQRYLASLWLTNLKEMADSLKIDLPEGFNINGHPGSDFNPKMPNV